MSKNAFTTHQKIPRVRNVSGSVIRCKNTPMVALMSAITSAAINAATNPFTWKPGTNRVTISNANAFNNSRMIHRMRVAYSYLPNDNCSPTAA